MVSREWLINTLEIVIWPQFVRLKHWIRSTTGGAGTSSGMALRSSPGMEHEADPEVTGLYHQLGRVTGGQLV